MPPCLVPARDTVRYVGEPVAFVVAGSREIARDAADSIIVDPESLPPVVSLRAANKPVGLAGSAEQCRV